APVCPVASAPSPAVLADCLAAAAPGLVAGLTACAIPIFIGTTFVLGADSCPQLVGYHRLAGVAGWRLYVRRSRTAAATGGGGGGESVRGAHRQPMSPQGHPDGLFVVTSGRYAPPDG